MPDIIQRVRERFVYIMCSTWSIVNSKAQIRICEHSGLVDYDALDDLPCCIHEIPQISL